MVFRSVIPVPIDDFVTPLEATQDVPVVFPDQVYPSLIRLDEASPIRDSRFGDDITTRTELLTTTPETSFWRFFNVSGSPHSDTTIQDGLVWDNVLIEAGNWTFNCMTGNLTIGGWFRVTLDDVIIGKFDTSKQGFVPDDLSPQVLQRAHQLKRFNFTVSTTAYHQLAIRAGGPCVSGTAIFFIPTSPGVWLRKRPFGSPDFEADRD